MTPADIVVVLGCRVRVGLPTPALLKRVAAGVAAWRQGAAPVLLMSGGRGEAALMREAAIGAGVPEDAILTEEVSENTAENAVMAAALLQHQGRRRIFLVTDRRHLPRARLLFRMAGFEVVGTASPPPRGSFFEAVYLLREALATPLGLVRMLRMRRGASLRR